MITILGSRNSIHEYFLVCLPKDFCRENFIATSGVTRGLGLQLVERFYDLLTVATLDLNREYKKYYALEYSSFEEFLYWKYDIDSETLEQAGGCPPDTFWLGLGKLYLGGDNAGWLLEGDNPPAAIEAITAILEQFRERATGEN